MTIHWHFEKTSREASAGVQPLPGSRGTVTKYNSGAETYSIPASFLPGPADLALLRAPFYSRMQQALMDSFALLFCVSFVIVLLLSIPLAIFLLFFAL